MNRRHILKLAAATVVTPKLSSSAMELVPRTPDGDSWDNWAAGMSEWEREALTGDFSKRFAMNWPNGVRGGWLLELGNYEQSCGGSWWNVISWNENVSLFWIVHPTYYALDDLQNAASWFRHVGVPVLGTGGTECGRVACCFLNEPKDEVLGVARAWRLSQWEGDA